MVALDSNAGLVHREVDLPKLDAASDRLCHTALYSAVVRAGQHLEAGIVIEKTQQQYRALMQPPDFGQARPGAVPVGRSNQTESAGG